MPLRHDGEWTTREFMRWWTPLLFIPVFAALSSAAVRLLISNDSSTLDSIMGGFSLFTFVGLVAIAVWTAYKARSLATTQTDS